MKLKKRFLHTYGIKNLENINKKNLEKSLVNNYKFKTM